MIANRQAAKQTFYYGWIIVAVCFVTMSLVSPVGTLFQLFYQAFESEFHWKHASISGIFGLHQFLNGIISPLVGWLLDRYGPRKVMPIGALILGIGLATSSEVTSLWQLYLTFGVIAAFGVAMLQSVPNTALVSNWFVRNRGTAIGIMMSGSGFGQLWMTPVTQWLIIHFGWRQTYLVLAPLVFAIPAGLILLFQYHKPTDVGLPPAEEREDTSRKWKREVIILDQKWASTKWTPATAVRTRRFWAMMVVTITFSVGYFLISPQLFVLTQEHPEFQVHSVIVAFILGAEGLHKGTAKLFGGFVSDRLGREMTMTLSLGSLVLGIAILDLVQKHPSALLLYVAILAYGLGYGFSLPALMASYADLFQGPKFGAILGFLTLGGLVGGGLGSSLGGHLRDVTGGYSTSFLIAAIAFILAAALIWNARPGGIRIVKRVPIDAVEAEGQPVL